MQNSSITMNTALKEYNRIFREINLIYQETAQSLGLSHSAFDIYYAICQLGDGCRQKDIADHTFLSKQTINSTIHQMEKDGLITLRPGKGRSRIFTHIGKINSTTIVLERFSLLLLNIQAAG